MSKFLYTYSVVNRATGKVIYAHDTDKARAERLAVAAVNNRPGQDYKIRTHRHTNPAYVG